MKFNEQTNQLIEAYLTDTLNEEQSRLFENEINQNKDLAELVSIYKNMKGFYDEDSWSSAQKDNKALIETKKQFKTQSFLNFKENLESYNIKKNKKKRIPRYIYSSAAVILLLFSLSYFIISDTNSSSQLFSKYYDVSDLPSFTVQDYDKSALAKAEYLYNTNKFEDALAAFNVIESEQDEFTPNLYVYLGLCHMQLGNFEEALIKLDTLLQSDTLDNHKALWYKCLVYLKQDKSDKALEVLNIILEKSTNFNYEKAKSLIDDMR